MARWKTEKHFCSWLRLCPDNKISGGKRSRGKPHRGHNRAAQILRVCAQAAIQSKSALGAFDRRLRARMDAPRAIKALAHKLARLIYRMLSAGAAYKDIGEHYYEERYRAHLVARLQNRPRISASISPRNRVNDVLFLRRRLRTLTVNSSSSNETSVFPPPPHSAASRVARGMQQARQRSSGCVEQPLGL
jgi:hypothetical protein